MNIIIFGTMGSGKDSVARLIQLTAYEKDYVIGKLGGAIRSDVDRVATEGADKRQLYQDYGETMRDLFGKDHWNNIIDSKFSEILEAYPSSSFIIADARQPHEMDYWTARGFVTVGVTAGETKRLERLKDRDGVDQTHRLGHITEQTAEQCVSYCNYIVENNGSLEDLMDAVATLMEAIDEMQYGLGDDRDDSED